MNNKGANHLNWESDESIGEDKMRGGGGTITIEGGCGEEERVRELGGFDVHPSRSKLLV